MKRNPILGTANDQRLAAAIEKSNLLITLSNQKQNIRLKLESDLTYAKHGGIFKIDPQLISFVQALLSRDQTDAILVDVKNNPIAIDNLEEFADTIVEVYYEAMNSFMVEFKKIQKSRTVESLTGIS